MKKANAFLLCAVTLLGTTFLFAATSDDLRQMGEALMQKGLYTKAADYYQQATQTDPKDWRSYEDLGNAYMKMNENSQALDAYQKSLQINPNNPTLQTLVDNLKTQTPPPVSTNPAPSAAAHGTDDQWETAQPVTVGQVATTADQPTTIIERTVVVERPRPRPRPTPVDYHDGLASIDHARAWVQVSMGYANAKTGDFTDSTTGWNQDIAANGWTGSATMPNDAIESGAQLGFLLNPNNGLAIGVKYMQLSDYNLNVNLQNGPSPITVAGNPVTYSDGTTVIYDSDFEQTTLTPSVLPITLDYYLFLPDGGGRFFLSGGVGWYFGTVHVETNYSYVITNSDPNAFNQGSGDLHANAIGFQARIGREFQVAPRIGLTLYVGGQYAKLTNFTGVVVDPNGNGYNVGLAVEPTQKNDVRVEDRSDIGGTNNNGYATIDYTALEAGVALNFYSF
jgi:tetratricopeptide (TPR) repeat protein